MNFSAASSLLVPFMTSCHMAPIDSLIVQVGFLFEETSRRRERKELSNMAAQFAEDPHCEALYLWLERRDDPNRDHVGFNTVTGPRVFRGKIKPQRSSGLIEENLSNVSYIFRGQ